MTRIFTYFPSISSFPFCNLTYDFPINFLFLSPTSYVLSFFSCKISFALSRFPQDHLLQHSFFRFYSIPFSSFLPFTPFLFCNSYPLFLFSFPFLVVFHSPCCFSPFPFYMFSIHFPFVSSFLLPFILFFLWPFSSLLLFPFILPPFCPFPHILYISSLAFISLHAPYFPHIPTTPSTTSSLFLPTRHPAFSPLLSSSSTIILPHFLRSLLSFPPSLSLPFPSTSFPIPSLSLPHLILSLPNPFFPSLLLWPPAPSIPFPPEST